MSSRDTERNPPWEILKLFLQGVQQILDIVWSKFLSPWLVSVFWFSSYMLWFIFCLILSDFLFEYHMSSKPNKCSNLIYGVDSPFLAISSYSFSFHSKALGLVLWYVREVDACSLTGSWEEFMADSWSELLFLESQTVCIIAPPEKYSQVESCRFIYSKPNLLKSVR